MSIPSLKIEATTNEKRDKLVKELFPSIVNPAQLEYRKLFYYSFKKKYELIINEKENEFLEILIIDGSKKKNIVQIFTKKMALNVCSCSLFNESELGYCDHIAAIQRFLKDDEIKYFNKSWTLEFTNRRKRLPESLQEYKGCQIKIYDSRNVKEIVVGKKIDNIEPRTSINHHYYKQFDNETIFNNRYQALINKNISSEGLLNNIQLFDYQEDVFKKIIAAKRAAISMVVGSGKTITAISACKWIENNENNKVKILVVAPKSLKLQWQAEFKKRASIDSTMMNKEKDIDVYLKSGNNAAICTYQFVQRYVEQVKKMNFDIVIADEIQFIKNNETKTWKSFSKLKSEYFFALSGTFIENNLMEFYNLLEIIHPKFLGPRWKFEMKYQNVLTLNNHHVVYKGTRNIPELKEKLKSVVFSYDNLVLPKIHYIDEFVDLSATEQAMHDEHYHEAKALLSKSLQKPLMPVEKMRLQMFLTRSRQCCNTIELVDETRKISSAKMNKYIELINEYCFQKNEKIVVFSCWTTMLNILERETKKNFPSIKSVIYSGELNIKQRENILKTFENDSDCKILLISDAGNKGIDRLQLVSRTLINFEIPFNPAVCQQRNARLHRIGQTKEVYIHNFYANNSIDIKLLETNIRKEKIRQEVMF